MKILLHLGMQDETLYKPVLHVEIEGTKLVALGFIWNSESRKNICEVFYTIWKSGFTIGHSLKIVV